MFQVAGDGAADPQRLIDDDPDTRVHGDGVPSGQPGQGTAFQDRRRAAHRLALHLGAAAAGIEQRGRSTDGGPRAEGGQRLQQFDARHGQPGHRLGDGRRPGQSSGEIVQAAQRRSPVDIGSVRQHVGELIG